MSAVRKSIGGFRCIVSDWRRYCKAVCDVKFSQIEENGQKCCHIQISNSVISKSF